MHEPVILSAVRTPIGKFLGSLSSLSATRMGALVVAEAIRRAGVSPDWFGRVEFRGERMMRQSE